MSAGMVGGYGGGIVCCAWFGLDGDSEMVGMLGRNWRGVRWVGNLDGME